MFVYKNGEIAAEVSGSEILDITVRQEAEMFIRAYRQLDPTAKLEVKC